MQSEMEENVSVRHEKNCQKVAKEYPILVKNTKKSDNTFGKTNEYL